MIWIVLGTVGIIGATIAAGLLADRKWGLLPRPKQPAEERPRLSSHAPGESPATAITGATAIETVRNSQRCRACRSAMDVLADDHVRYNDRDMIVLHFRCPRCEAKLSLYVAPGEA
jgi:hypothetical protein